VDRWEAGEAEAAWPLLIERLGGGGMCACGGGTEDRAITEVLLYMQPSRMSAVSHHCALQLHCGPSRAV
jgi:hypothetical protein